MSTNISGGVELGGVLSIGHLQEKNQNKPVKGQKLSARKDLTKAANTAKAATGDGAAIKKTTGDDLYAILTKKDASDNVAYEVDGVRFSAEEMKSMREALGDVFTSVKQPGSNLVYSDYAKMGIAENVVRSYAEKNLSGEQADVIMKVVSEHMDQVINGEVEAEIVDENLYYGKRVTGEEFDRLFRKLYEASKEFVANSDFYSDEKKKRHSEYIDRCLETRTSGGILMSASNTKLSSALRSGFARLDFENEDDLQMFFKQYQDWMKPAYLEVHGGFKEAVEEHIAEDITLYKKQYKDLMSSVLAASVAHVNLQI